MSIISMLIRKKLKEKKEMLDTSPRVVLGSKRWNV